MTPRFVVAKYAADLGRMEPRNIGVILWAKGEAHHKFLSDDVAATIVSELDVYRRWVNFWSASIAGTHIEPRRGDPVPLSDPACLDALITTQKGNYILTDAGRLMQSLRKKEIGNATSFLFRELVALKGDRQKNDSLGFASRCQTVLEASGIAARDDFKQKYEVEVNVYGVKRPVHFSYGFGNGHPNALLQRVHFTKEESVTSSLLKLHSLIYNSSVLRADAVRVLFRRSDVASETSDKALAQFANVCETVDVEADDSIPRLKQLLQLSA